MLVEFILISSILNPIYEVYPKPEIICIKKEDDTYICEDDIYEDVDCPKIFNIKFCEELIEV
jgi:hypothetical protein